MKVKYIFHVIFILIKITTVQGQGSIKLVNNQNIKFEVIRKSSELIDSNNLIPAKYYIRVHLSNKNKTALRTQSKEIWLKLLNDSSSDWAANLILYDLYKRNAVLFNSVLKNQNAWRLSAKKDDIKYWSEYLK